MTETVKYVAASGVQGIKLQLLHVLRGTDLEKEYADGQFQTMSLEAYVSLLKKLLPLIPDDVVIHRLTGDGPKRLLIAPLWSADKKKVLNTIRREVLAAYELIHHASRRDRLECTGKASGADGYSLK